MASDYAQLARRISAVTTNCLLTAVVLVAGLGFGRQVLRWWSEDPVGSPAVMADNPTTNPVADPEQLHLIQFGESGWSLRRQSITGDGTVCRDVLQESVSSLLPQRGMPSEVEDATGYDATDNPTDEFLAQLATTEPVEQEPGLWRLYELDGAFPMVIGTRVENSAEDTQDGGNLAAADHGMVIWGLALPAGPEAWTLFVFEPQSAAIGPSAEAVEIPIPEACRRTLSMEVAGGGATLAFEGEASPETWVAFYDQWFTSHNWSTPSGWQQYGDRWHARYIAPGHTPRGSAEVYFSSHAPDRSVGLLMIDGFGFTGARAPNPESL
jgi:hypothetical protein